MNEIICTYATSDFKVLLLKQDKEAIVSVSYDKTRLESFRCESINDGWAKYRLVTSLIDSIVKVLSTVSQ